MTIYNEPPPGMFIVPDESDMTLVIKFQLLIKNYNFINMQCVDMFHV